MLLKLTVRAHCPLERNWKSVKRFFNKLRDKTKN
jgi:hypothetical protein